MARTRKIYYRPGMISLLFIPILLVYFAYKRLPPKYYVKEINWYNKSYEKHYGFIPIIPKRNYLDITLTGSIDSDKVRLAFGDLQLGAIMANHDTINGINFHFGTNAQYRDFIAVLDMADINGLDMCIPSDDGIKLFYYKGKLELKPSKYPPMTCY